MHATPASARESRCLTADRFNSAISPDFQPRASRVWTTSDFSASSLKLIIAGRATCLTFFSPTLMMNPSSPAVGSTLSQQTFLDHDNPPKLYMTL